MTYCIKFLSVGDADAIVIGYKQNTEADLKIALIDAGNIGDSDKVKSFIKDRYNSTRIDLAVCTHPDIDHKGGFFGIVADEEFTIGEFWLKFPASVLEEEDYDGEVTKDELIAASMQLYDHPKEPLNLIEMLDERGVDIQYAYDGKTFPSIPIKVLGPSESSYVYSAMRLLEDKAAVAITKIGGCYEDVLNENLQDTITALNQSKQDSSSNACSLILTFTPRPGKTYLLTGDATVEAMQELIGNHKKEITNSILKVPHHGSINNLTTDIIDAIRPSKAIISCAESEEHPDKNVVRYLREYCDVYSTHFNKNYGITNTSLGKNIEPFKTKIIK